MGIEQGVVTINAIDQYGKHYIRLDGNAGYFSSKFAIKGNVGDTVTFDSGPGGKWCSKLQVLAAGVGGVGAPAPMQPGVPQAPAARPAPAGVDTRQESIQAQNALTNTVNAVGGMNAAAKKEWFGFFGIPKEDQNDGVLHVYVHNYFAKLINGAVSVDKLKEAKEAAVAPPETDPAEDAAF